MKTDIDFSKYGGTLTPYEVAEILHHTVKTIYGMIDKGKIPAIKVGRKYVISKRELVALIKDGRRL